MIKDLVKISKFPRLHFSNSPVWPNQNISPVCSVTMSLKPPKHQINPIDLCDFRGAHEIDNAAL